MVTPLLKHMQEKKKEKENHIGSESTFSYVSV